MDTIRGTVQRIVYEAGSSDFKVFRLRRKDRSVISVTGEFPNLIQGAAIEVHGDYRTHPKYGVGFRADAHTHTHDGSARGMCLYLMSIAKFVGPDKSARLAEHFGERLEEVIEREPDRLTEVEGIGPGVATSIVEAWAMNKTLKDVKIFLHGLGLTDRRIRKILTSFGPDSEKILKEDPWSLTVHGFGFGTCDHIAQRLKKDRTDPLRWRGFTVHALARCSGAGHLYLTRENLLAAYNQYSNASQWPFKDGGEISWADVEPHIGSAVSLGMVVVDGERLYNTWSFFHESESARLVDKMLSTEGKIDLGKVNPDKFIKKYEELEGITLSEAQRDAVRSFLTDKMLIITGGPGTGKCLGRDTPVMMSDGSVKAVQDVVAGDLLMGDDSSPRRVLNTCTGREELYEVTPVKGDSYVVNKSHILSLKTSPRAKGEKRTVKDISVAGYLSLSQKARHHLKGYRVPVSYPSVEVPIDPYLFGFWLGNGDSGSVRISTPFEEVVSHVTEIVSPCGLSDKKVSGDNVDYDVTRDRNSEVYSLLVDKRSCNPFLTGLRSLGVVGNKHIPRQYLINSESTRLRLLAGIIDSDGHLDRCGTYDIVFKNTDLSSDVVRLARSLGFAAYRKRCRKSWRCFRKGKHYEGVGTYHRICVSGDLERIPVVVPKKKATPRRQKKDVLVTGIKLHSIGVGDYFGFEIDGNGRFLLGDFTVTHNTTIVRALVSILSMLNASFELLTPTGISAKKLGTTAGCPAYTIHRRLGYKGDRWDFNALVKYPTQAVIVDETSMVDQEVLYRLLSALLPSTKVVFVGDNDQLPSVGPGSVLRELIESRRVKTIFLDKIFRQEHQSDIIKAAKKIRDGDIDLSLFKADKAADIWLVRGKDHAALERTVVSLATQIMAHNRASADKKHFQIITPRNNGPLSVDSLNEALQAALNPPASDKKEFMVNRVPIRKGDRIIIKKNNYQLEVFNGDIGKVAFVTPDHVTVDVEDYNETTRRVDIPMREADEMLRMAYAITVHRSQGLEYPLVIMPFVQAHGRMLLQRNLLYTALTRAKRKVIVLGQASALERAIANDKIQRRNTLFAERIRQWGRGEGRTIRSLFPNPEDYRAAETLKRLLSYEANC